MHQGCLPIESVSCVGVHSIVQPMHASGRFEEKHTAISKVTKVIEYGNDSVCFVGQKIHAMTVSVIQSSHDYLIR